MAEIFTAIATHKTPAPFLMRGLAVASHPLHQEVRKIKV
jgi:hypothetical protein